LLKPVAELYFNFCFGIIADFLMTRTDFIAVEIATVGDFEPYAGVPGEISPDVDIAADSLAIERE
jgi:hypothetical protein